MAGGKGKSTGGKAGPKETPGKTQKSHSAKAGLQVRVRCVIDAYFSSRPEEATLSSLASTRIVEIAISQAYDLTRR